MRTFALMLCLALLSGTVNTALAQGQPKGKPSPEEMATKRTAKLAEALTLTDSQKEQVYAIILEHIQQKEEVNNTKLTQDERHSNMKELHANFESKLKQTLSAEQYQKYLAHKEEMKKKKHDHHGPHSKGGKN